MKWIKTEDRVPETGELILFVSKEAVDSSGNVWPSEKWLGVYYPDNVCPFSSVGGWSYTKTDILYWMPFPRLPEGILDFE